MNEYFIPALGLSVVLAMVLSIMAAALSPACRIVRVSPPDFFPAFGYSFLLVLAMFLLLLLLGAVMGAATGTFGISSLQELGQALGRGLLIGFFLWPIITAAIYSAVLPDCGLVKGFVIWLLQLVVLALIGAVLVGAGMALHRVTGL